MLYFIFTSNLSGVNLLVFILAYLISVVLALVLHEVSHSFVAYKCGDLTAKTSGRLSFNPFSHFDVFGLISFLFIGFGWAKPVPINPYNFKNYKKGIRLVSSSGVVTNFILAFIFSGLSFFFAGNLISSTNAFLNFLGFFLELSFLINCSYAIFNMFPIYPLDGFNFLRSFMKPNNKFVLFMERWGNLILILFIITSAFDFIYQYFLYGIEFLFYGFWGLF